MDLLGGLDAPAPTAAQQGSGMQQKLACFSVMSAIRGDTMCIFQGQLVTLVDCKHGSSKKL